MMLASGCFWPQVPQLDEPALLHAEARTLDVTYHGMQSSQISGSVQCLLPGARV